MFVAVKNGTLVVRSERITIILPPEVYSEANNKLVAYPKGPLIRRKCRKNSFWWEFFFFIYIRINFIPIENSRICETEFFLFE